MQRPSFVPIIPYQPIYSTPIQHPSQISPNISTTSVQPNSNSSNSPNLILSLSSLTINKPEHFLKQVSSLKYLFFFNCSIFS